MSRLNGVTDWLHSRTGYRTARHHLLEEPIPSGAGWWFTTGSIVLFLLTIQLVTGVVLAMYYVPSPADAYDSVRFIGERLAFGHVLRGLHHFGASFIVIASVVHMLRVVVYASYKRPRELNWVVGVLLLLVIMAFALTGYLLPWDQRAYWATTVTINIARSGPFGGFLGGLMRGGPDLGALTLLRWYAAHVFLLPACLIGFTVAHLFLMRRQGISGPMTHVPGKAKPFYPYHALKDTIAAAAVFALLLTLAITQKSSLEAVADPTGGGFIPRPEWYFLSLFQLLKYFPGKLEPVATLVIPGITLALLFLLPFIDRDPTRNPAKRPIALTAFALGFIVVGGLTYLGYKDSPANADPSQWGLLPLAGREFVQGGKCESCHRAGGAASPIDHLRPSRDQEWLVSHVRDPEVIAPGLRPAPRGGLNEGQALAVASYVRKMRLGGSPSARPEEVATAVAFGQYCALCHKLDGDGGTSAPDLSRIGAKRDAGWLKNWITDPSGVDPKSTMPAFGGLLQDEQMAAIVGYLSARK